MPTEVIMPKVDMDMDRGKVSVWHVAEGETVEKGAALFDIETDKAAMEVEAPASGKLHHVLAQPGADVPVGHPIAWIYAEGEEVGAIPDAADMPAAEPRQEAPSGSAPGAEGSAPNVPLAVSASDLDRPRATPAARRMVRAAGLDLADISGSGPHGRIQAADVERAIEARRRAPAPPPSRAPEAVEPSAPSVWADQSGALHVSRSKGEGRPLVMIHGFAADSMGWRPFEQALASRRPLIRIDLPSHGRSPRRRFASFPDFVRSVREAFDAVGLDEPVDLLAHSLGGAVALALADVRPRNIASLALIAPAGLGPQADAETLLGIARASRAESLAPWLKRLAGSPDAISWDFVKAAMVSREDPDLRQAQLDLAGVLFPDGTQSFDLSAALDRLEVPTTMIWGRRDMVIPWQHALRADGTVALHLLRESGHIPHVECPATVAGIVKRHLECAGR
ncbi:MAG: acetoin dehydrogenase dihydrolipoyllysine-residue acetyltransferase subunit [Rhodobacteraceae bacterium]|nr:acetoin dehydrogenase dihydrolipoyllysine-residue acetyltransferase subunit [Paracoccaceae bacterium]